MKNKHVLSRLLPVLTLSVFLLLNGCQSGTSDVKSETKQIDAESHFHGMYIFGEAEKVTVVSEDFTYKARLDTGATTTSIHALDISDFTRDGKKWVRFSLVDPETKEKKQLERSLSRIASIKRHGAEDQKRPVVKLKFQMGPVEKVCEVSLTDRGNFEYPVLV
ncbi:MAG: ATP-dependent zinc protease family protein, partial [Planctomycetota bacterium]